MDMKNNKEKDFTKIYLPHGNDNKSNKLRENIITDSKDSNNSNNNSNNVKNEKQ